MLVPDDLWVNGYHRHEAITPFNQLKPVVGWLRLRVPQGALYLVWNGEQDMPELDLRYWRFDARPYVAEQQQKDLV
jgi:hypothetical protein